MKKSILTFGLLLATICTIATMFTVENLWGNSITPLNEANNENNRNNYLKDEIIVYSTCTWQGTTSTDWNNPLNWTPEIVPSSTVDVIISPGIKQPVISSLAECHSITIQSGASLTIMDANTLKVYGDWTNLGTFNRNMSTVIFNGTTQRISKSSFYNLTIAGNGVKTEESIEVTVYNILSVEENASLLNKINYQPTATLQYNIEGERLTDIEWPSPLIIKEVLIKKGVITLKSNKTLDISSLKVQEGATLDINRFTISCSGDLHLECGGKMMGSILKGTALLTLGGNVIVENSLQGLGAAEIECPINVGTCTFDVSDGNSDLSNPTDLWINALNATASLKKTGLGTMSIRGATNTISNLTIDNGNFIIQPSGSVSFGRLYNNVGYNGLILLSDANGTGSLTVGFSDVDKNKATLKRHLTSGAWHLVSTPLLGQTIGVFLTANSAIPTPIGGATDPRAMRAYEPIGNQWGEFFSSTNTNPLTIGTGYCMRVKASAPIHEVVFTGTLQAGDKIISGLSAGNWNCIGNPYTSAIGITSSATSTANFLNVNAVINSNIDPAYGIYIWDNPDAANGQEGKYTAISNVSNLQSLHYLQQGQGFMVKMATGKTSVSFTKAMQVHNPSLTLKSTEDLWPTIKLMASGDSVSSSTVIAFHEGMTKGLDPTYDAGLLQSGGSMELYTRLVDDYGIPFAIQALPSGQYDQLVIPIGVDYSKDGKVSFSAENFYLPSSCHPILEDQLTGILTDLSNKTYSADLTANTSGTGRFYLHTSYATTNIYTSNKKHNLNADFINPNQLKIQGIPLENATVYLTDAVGRKIVLQKMKKVNINIINIPTIKPGVYLLSITNNKLTHTIKLMYGY